jgi:WD40 repeat protein
VNAPSQLSAALAGRYTLEREIGAGGMATVYLAHDLKHDRDVAIKVLHPDLGAALGADRFLSEIRTTARLQHPHLLALLDSGDADGLLYYVMPVVNGESLRARLRRERQLAVADAVRIAREVASALDYAHRHGVIHRDIKPENILLHDGSAVVADFGIALAVQQAGGQRITQTGLSLGTPQYMSPEQAMGERTIDARSDIYALGAVTYEMLVGEPPFTGPSVQAIVARLMAEDPRPLVTQRKSVPEYVEAAVLHALEKLPADRFATAAEFSAALDGSAAGTTRPMSLRAARRTDRYAIWTLGAVALAAIAVAIGGWIRRAPPSEVTRYRIVIDSVPAVKEWSGEVAVSPDGGTIVRSGGPNGTLLVRRREELDFKPLAGTEGAWGPFFSSDGTQIGFYANAKVITVPVRGGPPTVLIDSMPLPEPIEWAPDGYLYNATLIDGTERIVRRQARAGSKIEQVTIPDTAAGEIMHLHAALLPDHKSIVFQIGYRDGHRLLAVGEIGARDHTTLFEGTRARYADGYLFYTTGDGKLWAVEWDDGQRKPKGTAVQVGDHVPTSIVGPVDFAVSRNGTLAYSVEDAGARRELVWVTRNGAHQPFDAEWKGEFSTPTLSPDGSRVAVSVRQGGQSDIWIKTVAGGFPTKLTGQQGQSNIEPAWTSDGRAVSFIVASGSGGVVGSVWRQRADGSGAAEHMARNSRPVSEQTWAGNKLVMRTTTPTSGAGDIIMLRAGIDSVPGPLVDTPYSEYTPTVSPDGKWLAYTSNETGRFEVYVVPFDNPGASKWPVSTTGGVTPRWSHHGDEIFYMDPRSNLVAARVTTTPSFSVQGSRVLFNAADLVQTSISRRNYDVATDDQRFLMVQRADGAKRGQVVVVEHITDELRRNRKQPN